MSDLVERLEPCPFCGCTDIVASKVGEDEDNWFVGCMEKDCGVNPGVFCPDSEAAAVAMWNRRSDATITALREEVARYDLQLNVAATLAKQNMDALTALRQRVVEVVGPFAEEANIYDGAPNDAAIESMFDIDQLRAARALVNEMETTNG